MLPQKNGVGEGILHPEETVWKLIRAVCPNDPLRMSQSWCQRSLFFPPSAVDPGTVPCKGTGPGVRVETQTPETERGERSCFVR